MNENRESFYAPENAVNIKNFFLQGLILDAIADKNNNITFLVDGEKIVFPSSKYTINHLTQYRQKLIRWAIDPFNPEEGIEGLGLEVLVESMLKEFYKEDTDLVVFNTPATVDFIDRKIYKKWGPTGDIIVGRKKDDLIEPLLMYTTSLNESKSVKFHEKLKVPIINICGNKLFNNMAQFYLNLFASHHNPAAYAITLAQRSPFKENLGKIATSPIKQ